MLAGAEARFSLTAPGLEAAGQATPAVRPSVENFDATKPITLEGKTAGTGIWTGSRGAQVYLLFEVVTKGKPDLWAAEVGRMLSLKRNDPITVTGFPPKPAVKPAELVPSGAMPMLLEVSTARRIVYATGVALGDGTKLVIR